MRNIRFLIALFLLGLTFNISAMRVDSFSIVHTEIHLSVRNFSAKYIEGHVRHQVVFKVKSNWIQLDLKQVQVDSILLNTSKLTFVRNQESLLVQFPQNQMLGDTVLLDIFYQGTPATDPSGWGGFYFSGEYAFNLGVGFAVFPHSYGRAWFPCVDEFPMKSSYEMFIETDTDYIAACNGLLIDVNTTSQSKIWHYKETVPMSAYLASVSVSKFAVLKSQYTGISKTFPTQVYCKPSDSLKVKSSFVHLPDAIHFFEEAFGPQPYSKVGYNLVPFNGGAMEHAGNITFPALFADGTINYETTMAHELSHHWWGDQVTCKDAGDMWLNEGWASYCEHLFTEKLYGREAYNNSILSNHVYVLRYAHIIDAHVYSLTDIPQDVTYGTHVYKKGADVIHSLRGVLGDSMFFNLCKIYQRNYRLKNASSIDMRNLFRDSGGALIAEKFFDHFVLDKGFPHVIITRQIHSGNGPFHIRLFTRQSPRFKTLPYEQLPISIRFFKDRHTFIDKKIIVNNVVDSFDFDLPFKAIYVASDFEGLLSDAISDRTIVTSDTGNYDLPETFCQLRINSINDTSLIRLEHHWVGPETYITTYPYMSNYRYWSMDGIGIDSIKMDLTMIYDGRQGATSSNSGYLDHTLIFKTEDSLTVLYRAFPGDYWREWPDRVLLAGNKNDKQGKIILKNARKGDYVLAMRDISLGIKTDKTKMNFKLLPNPTDTYFKLQKSLYYSGKEAKIYVLDAMGKLIYQDVFPSDLAELKIDTSAWNSGQYSINIVSDEGHENLKLSLIK